MRERGRNYARLQPEINIRIAMGARVNGINMEKVLGLLSGSFGVKISHRQNLKLAELKIRDAIKELYKTRKEEKLQEYNVASRKLPEYKPMEWEYE